MRKILALAVVAGGLATGVAAAPASAECYGTTLGYSYAYACRERVWEYQVWTFECRVDTNFVLATQSACAKREVIRYMG